MSAREAGRAGLGTGEHEGVAREAGSEAWGIVVPGQSEEVGPVDGGQAE
jgi:hypothetical protein